MSGIGGAQAPMDAGVDADGEAQDEYLEYLATLCCST